MQFLRHLTSQHNQPGSQNKYFNKSLAPICGENSPPLLNLSAFTLTSIQINSYLNAEQL